MCFPKFNPAGFVHAYVSYVLEDVALVFVSADREAFEDLRGWKDMVLEVSESWIMVALPSDGLSVELGKGQHSSSDRAVDTFAWVFGRYVTQNLSTRYLLRYILSRRGPPRSQALHLQV
jgi:hypothetical protein